VTGGTLHFNVVSLSRFELTPGRDSCADLMAGAPSALWAMGAVRVPATEGLVRLGVDVTLFATADSLTSAHLVGTAPTGYSEDPGLDAKVWEGLHISALFERADEFDLIHNSFDFLPLTYSALVDTPVVTTIHGFSSERIVPVYEEYNDSSYYVAIMVLIAAVLSSLVFAAFGVPLVGSLVDYAIVLALLIAASLALGFVISSLVTSDTQAVNITMIVLLLSTFFSGFFMPLERLIEPVRAVSWLLPMTHGLAAMRDIMFGGSPIGLNTSLPLALGAVSASVAAWLLLRSRLHRH
jgi:hypothetical protein